MTETTTESTEAAGSRFPFISLEKALGRAEQLFSAAAGHEMTAQDVFETWGYSPKSSGGFQTIAALKSYGLLRASKNGDTIKLALTANAINYFRDERPETKLNLLKQFALEPALIKVLWTIWGFTPPADHIARSHLKIDRGLSDQSARALLGIFKENIDFAKLKSDNMPSGMGAVDNVGQNGDMPPPPPPPDPSGSERKVKIMEGERELTTGLLSKGTSFRLIVSGKIGPVEIDRLIKKLELDKEILAEPEADEGAAD